MIITLKGADIETRTAVIITIGKLENHNESEVAIIFSNMPEKTEYSKWRNWDELMAYLNVRFDLEDKDETKVETTPKRSRLNVFTTE